MNGGERQARICPTKQSHVKSVFPGGHLLFVTSVSDPPAPPQVLPELINAALSILYVLGLLLLFADAQKFEHCEEVEGNFTSRSEL